jgi:hypothetical protein
MDNATNAPKPWIGTLLIALALTLCGGAVDSAAAATSLLQSGNPPPPVPALKRNFGHYFSTHYSDTPAAAATLCEQVGVSGVVWHQTWSQVEPASGIYDFRSFDAALAAIAASRNPHCQLWLFVEFKSFNNSPVRNPCPAYLQARHSGLNAFGKGAATCFMWQFSVVNAYSAMMKAAAAHFDRNPRIEGFIIQESSLGFNGKYAQDAGNGGPTRQSPGVMP